MLSRRLWKFPQVRTLRGGSLLEALVALSVLAIGALGLMMMQAAIVRVQGEAQMRAQAALFADEIIARMRLADPATVRTAYKTGGSGFLTWLNSGPRASAGGLPSADATVTFDAPGRPVGSVEVRILWLARAEKLPGASVTTVTSKSLHQHVTVTAIDG